MASTIGTTFHATESRALHGGHAGREGRIGTLCGREAALEAIGLQDVPALLAHLVRSGERAGTARPLEPTGCEATAGFISLSPAQRNALLSQAWRADCVVAGRHYPACAVWPIPGRHDRAWAKLPDGLLIQLKKIPSDVQLGYVYADHVQRGGSGFDLDDSPAYARTIALFSTLTPIGAESDPTLQLQLPSGLLEHALSRLGEAQQNVWRQRLPAVLDRLQEVDWDRDGRGQVYESVRLHDGHGDIYTVSLDFKRTDGASDPAVLPTSAQLTYLQISREGTDEAITAREDDWLEAVLEAAGVEVPATEAIWRCGQADGSFAIAYLPASLMDVPGHILAYEQLPEALRQALPKYNSKALSSRMLDALSEGSALNHQLIGVNGSYELSWNGIRLNVDYHLRHDTRGVDWICVFHQDLRIGAWGDDDGDDLEPVDWSAVDFDERIAGLRELNGAARRMLIDYYKTHFNPFDSREHAPDDGYLAAPIRLLSHLPGNMTVEQFEALDFEGCKAQVSAHIDTFKQNEVTAERGYLAPFVVSLHPDEGWSEPPDHVNWNGRIRKFDALTDAGSRLALTQHCRRQYAVGFPLSNIQRAGQRIREFLMRHPIGTLRTMNEQAQNDCMEAFCNRPGRQAKAYRSPINQFLEQERGSVSVKWKPTPPTEPCHLADLAGFCLWRYPDINDIGEISHESHVNYAKSLLSRWMREIEEKQQNSRALALQSDPGAIQGTLPDGRPLTSYLRSYRTWVHLDTYLHRPELQPDPAAREAEGEQLTKWLHWRAATMRGGIYIGAGPWQLLEQLPGMDEDQWNAHVDSYLRGARIDETERDAVRKTLDAFREWVLDPDAIAQREAMSKTLAGS